MIVPFVAALLAATARSVNGGNCQSESNNGTLQFKSPSKGIFYLPLLRGLSVNVDCCLFGNTNTNITWTVNGVPLLDSNVTAQLILSEQRQILTTSASGLYVCTATDGHVSISKEISITTQNFESKCFDGSPGSLKIGYPPMDVYDVGLHAPASLTCEAVFYCGSLDLKKTVKWWKIREKPESFVYMLPDISGSLVNAVTGDWFNATAWYQNEAEGTVVVRAVLNIHNVTKYDLYNEDDNGYNCSDSSSSVCSDNEEKYYYQCAIVKEDIDETSQILYNLMTNVRLHSFPAATKATEDTPTHYADSSGWKREGIIFGCLLGAFVIAVALVAFLYARYEWHILVYFKRLAIMVRSRGKTTREFAYDCYVACTHEDELLVYDVLKEQLEKQSGYRLCLPERDFAVGAAIPEQIGSFIEKSEFFLAIISPRFWNTDWCNLAMDMALRTNAKVIGVFILDNPTAKADRRPNVAQALKTPGCSEFVFRSWKEHDNLALKLQYAIPRPRSRSHKQPESEAQAIPSTPSDLQLPQTTAQPQYHFVQS